MPFISKRSKLRIDSNILEQIIQISVSRTEAQSRVERAKIILAFYSGETVSAIAKSLNTNRPK